MRITHIALIVCCCCADGLAQDKVPVFVSGREGHEVYRIPAIIGVDNGDLLAFAEGRVRGSADFGDINIVMKRSKDGGRTWSSVITLVDNDSLQAGNPAPVVDRMDPRYPEGRIFLFYNTGNNHEGEVRKGNGLREVWYITSANGGERWTAPVNITTQVHRPDQPSGNPAYHFPEDWRSYANAPGHALQLRSENTRAGYLCRRIIPRANPWKHFAIMPRTDFTPTITAARFNWEKALTYPDQTNPPPRSLVTER